MGVDHRISFQTAHKQNPEWERARMRAVSPLNKLRCTKSASSSWTSTRTAPLTKMTSAVPSTTLVLMSEGELDGLLGEISGPCSFDNMVKMFQEKMAGDGNDPDDFIIQAFKAYDAEGKIDVKMFQHALMTWGDKMSKAEIDEIFDEFDIDEDYMVKTKEVLGLFVAQKEEEKKEPEPEPVAEEAPAEEDEGEAKKKKKKKKKAAK